MTVAAMIDVRIPLHDPVTAREGTLRIAGGIWAGDVCAFEFTDTVHGVSGTAACDWRSAQPRLSVDEGDTTRPEVRTLLGRIASMLLPLHRSAFTGIEPEQLRALYSGDYHRTMNYANESDHEANFKRNVVDQVLRLCSPRKVLDAGCSAGEVVRQLRARGIEAHGFDLCPDLEAIAYADVAPWLRQGSVDAIPFGPEHGFDTLLALDVFEHVPEHRVGAMVSEFARLGVQRVVAHIATCEFHYPGHITLRPLTWWDRQLAPWFQRVVPPAQPLVASAFGGDPTRYLRVYELAPVEAEI